MNHGVFAAVLMPIGFIIRIAMMIAAPDANAANESAVSATFISLLGSALWLWGFFHLTLHFRLAWGWGFLGILSIVGFFILLWLARDQPARERRRARRLATKPRIERRTDPRDPY